MQPWMTSSSQFCFSPPHPPRVGIIGVCHMLALNSFNEWILVIIIFIFMFKCVVMKLMHQSIEISNIVYQMKGSYMDDTLLMMK